jgi:hypothetical protein
MKYSGRFVAADIHSMLLTKTPKAAIVIYFQSLVLSGLI